MKTRFLICLIMTTLMVGCSDSEEPEVQKPKINLKSDFMGCWGPSFVTASVPTIGDSEYIVENSNPEVVSIEEVPMNNRTSFHIRNLQLGESKLTIIDKHDPEKRASFMCYVYGYPGTWRQTYASVQIDAEDKAVAAIIRRELTPKANGTTAFHFDDRGNLTVSMADKTEVKGTYEVPDPKDYSSLRLYYNGNVESFIVEPVWVNNDMTNTLERYLRTPIHILLADYYTTEYERRYPNAGITDVCIIKNLESDTYKMWDLTKWWDGLSDSQKEQYYPKIP